MVTDTNIREGRRSLRLGVQACSFALLLLLPLCFISSAAHAAANPVDGAIAWAQSFLFGQPNYTEGIYTYSGNCQTFVHDAYLHGGGVEIGTPTSYPYSAVVYWGDHPSLQHIKDPNPPRGALVYWGANAYTSDGHVGIYVGNVPGVGADEVISSSSWPEPDTKSEPVHYFSLSGRNSPTGGNDLASYLGWMTPPGVNLSNTGPIAMSSHLGDIVQWSGDTKAQKTAWLVVLVNGVVHRNWIPDIPTYWCLKDRGAPGPVMLSSAQLNAMPDMTGVWATCDMSQGDLGFGGDGSGITEQAGHNGARTFSDYNNASGDGPSVAPGQYVSVGCKVLDGNVPSSNPDGYWYQLLGEPWIGNYWAPANVFMNGDPWNGPYTHNTDFNVPDCGSGAGGGVQGGSAPPTTVGSYLEQEGHYNVNTFSNYDNASGRGPAVEAGQYVDVSCKVYAPTIASVSPDGYWYLILSAPWNDSYYAPANTFMNGDPWNGPYTHNTDFSVPDCGTAVQPPTTPPTSSTGYTEQEGHHGVNTFVDYHNASGEGPAIAPAADVQVSCKVYDPTIASVNPDGYWYLIASAPWNDSYYAPANTFMNGDPWNGPYTHNTDFSVPDCASAPTTSTLSTTYAETTGGVAHTWTDYADAGGTPGLEIASHQTVQITCRVSGWKAPDGNNWWYEIASSPWNNNFYVSADPFYNNGQASGSLQGTPFYDPDVPVCGSTPTPPAPVVYTITLSASPASLTANGVTTSLITATVTGPAHVGEAGVTVTFSDTAAGAANPSGACSTLPPTAVRGQVTGSAGTTAFVYTSSTTPGSCTITGMETITDQSNTVTLVQTSTPPAPVVYTITLSASPASLTANGVTTSLITATVTGPASAPVPGVTVTFSDTAAGAANPSGACGTLPTTAVSGQVTGSAGTTAFVYTSSLTPGSCTITGRETTTDQSNTVTLVQTSVT